MLFLLTSPRPNPILYYDWIVLEVYKLGLIGTIMVSIPQWYVALGDKVEESEISPAFSNRFCQGTWAGLAPYFLSTQESFPSRQLWVWTHPTNFSANQKNTTKRLRMSMHNVQNQWGTGTLKRQDSWKSRWANPLNSGEASNFSVKPGTNPSGLGVCIWQVVDYHYTLMTVHLFEIFHQSGESLCIQLQWLKDHLRCLVKGSILEKKIKIWRTPKPFRNLHSVSGWW